jgi:hypothetical protein
MTRCARPFGAAQRAFCALRASPAFAGMTSNTYAARSIRRELLIQNALFQIVLGVEQQAYTMAG